LCEWFVKNAVLGKAAALMSRRNLERFFENFIKRLVAYLFQSKALSKNNKRIKAIL
jgi:hypothetical protein